MSQRTEKVQKLAREILGEEIQGLKDPRVGFATVTAVRVTTDLRHMRVWVSVLGSEEERAQNMEGLRSATPFLRAELGRQMPLRYLPEMEFELDTSADEYERVETLLKKLHEGGEAG